MVLTDAGALGVAVRRARKTHGLTQAGLAGLAGTGPRFISELERGKASAELGKVLDEGDSPHGLFDEYRDRGYGVCQFFCVNAV